ncbi:MAG: hypothetical protein K2Z81_11950 [Cyanobacteria bacterium]|nr:hypothetical protein [Cyanobacteriota bacterium]
MRLVGLAVLSSLLLWSSSFNAVPSIALDRVPAQSPERSELADSDLVVFNEHSKKYHTTSCEWGKKAKSTVKIKRSEARKKGGVACKVCGGGEK